jgi:acyl-CoA synthetase (AMP-forming)/AMP-acid ligase II
VVIDPQWPFNIIYSSGTTGAPKGIVQPHAMRTPFAPATEPFGYGEHAVAIISTGLYSNTTLVSLFPALGSGSTVVLMAKFDARVFLQLAERHRVTHAMLVPVQYSRIMALADFDTFDLSAFQMKFCTSAPFSAALKADVLKRWPGGLTEYYGMTEGGGATVLFAHETPHKLHTVGKPWPWSDVRLIDDNGNEVAPGEVGEIVGASVSMMKGYHNQSQKTHEAMWYDKLGRPFIRNGDLGRFDEDGFLILMDRKKDMIISGGFNVYPSDLEAKLREHTAVADAAVVGVPSELWGETPVAFVVLHPGRAIAAEELRQGVNHSLGKVQRISSIVFLDALPRSHIGKVLKRELRDSYQRTRG